MIKIGVLYGHGINCDSETLRVLDRALKMKNVEGEAEKIHTNQLIRGRKKLENYHMLTIPGGFLHGDDISAGKILANKLKTKLSEEFEDFIGSGKLVLGVCNGFQVLAKYPVLPSSREQKVTLTWNDSGRFIDRWVYLKTNKDSPCIYLEGIDKIRLPIRHAEGKFIARKPVLDKLEANKQVALKYIRDNGDPAIQKYPDNPNGSLRDIAGICDKTGRIFGLMPHPEAFHSFYNHPEWTKQKIEGEIRKKGAGLKIFDNALGFLERNFV